MILLGASIALIGIVAGSLWREPRVAAWDRRLYLAVNRPQGLRILDGALRLVRPLGRGWLVYPVGVLVLAAGGWPYGLSFAAFAALLAVLEQGVKHGLRRPRPHMEVEGATLRIVPAPTDPSFPSGDAARAWFFTGTAIWGLPPWIAGLVLGLAMLVGVGRVRGGVHYPSDVLAGACLGMGCGLAWGGVIGLLTAGGP